VNKKKMSKNKRQRLQQTLEKTFDKVIGLADEVSGETIEVSDRYLVYVELAKDLVYLSLENKKSGKRVHDLHISVSSDLDVFFSGSVYRSESSLPVSTLEHIVQYAAKGTPQFTRGFEILVESISTEFQVSCFLSALEEVVS
jgi:hypothetical protein